MHDHGNSQELDYLCVDGFMRTVVAARALTTALGSGVIDHIAGHPACGRESLGDRFRFDGRGLELLLGLLASNGVIVETNGRISLTEQFACALRYRDLMEAKLDFAHLAARDLVDHFDDLARAPREFMRKASLFRLFSYGRCFTDTAENRTLTRTWMRFTSALTRYEARVCLALHDFSSVRRMLDIGGNSGEFSLQVCKRHPSISATVFDLPLVCEIGEEHVRHEPEAGRISFIKGNALADPLPTGFDLIAFKSVLHDWPEKEARQFLARAAQSLAPGGTILIFEREPLQVAENGVPYSMIPMLLFAHSFRSPDLYRAHLAELGFERIVVRSVNLETPFCLLTAIKKRVH